MGELKVGKHVLISAPSAPLELDGIPFRSEVFIDGEYLRFLSGQIVTGPGGGGSGGSFPTRPFRVTSDGVVEYDSIQAAIDAASADDVIYVPAPPSGTSGYNEQIVVNKRVNLVAIGGKRCRITHPAGPAVTVTSQCRITGFWIEADSGVSIRFDDGSEYAIMDDVETDSVEINLSSGYLHFSFVRCYTLTINSTAPDIVLYARFCHIGEVGSSNPSVIALYNSYLGSYSGAITIHHSGGTPANFPPSEQYRNYNIPWLPSTDSYLGWRQSRGYWEPIPISELPSATIGGIPDRPFIIRNGEAITFQSIQSAIDSSAYGESVFVPPGQYDESLDIPEGRLLIGIGRPVITTTQQFGHVITVSGYDVVVRNLRIIAGNESAVFIHGYASLTLDGCEVNSPGYEDCVENYGTVTVLNSYIRSGTGLCMVNYDEAYAINCVLHTDGTLTSTSQGARTVVIGGSAIGTPEPLDAQYVAVAFMSPVEPLESVNPIAISGVNVGDVLMWDGSRWLPGTTAGGPHHQTHEDGGADEISVTGLSGRLADYQKADQIGPWPVDISTPPQDGFVLGWSASQGKIVWLDPPQLSVSLPVSLSLMEASTQTESSAVSINLTLSNVPG